VDVNRTIAGTVVLVGSKTLTWRSQLVGCHKHRPSAWMRRKANLSKSRSMTLCREKKREPCELLREGGWELCGRLREGGASSRNLGGNEGSGLQADEMSLCHNLSKETKRERMRGGTKKQTTRQKKDSIRPPKENEGCQIYIKK